MPDLPVRLLHPDARPPFRAYEGDAGFDLVSVEAAELAAVPGVTSADRRGDSIVLTCTSSDEALRALLPRYPQLRDIEVRGGGLDEAFRQLTATSAAGSGAAGSIDESEARA